MEFKQHIKDYIESTGVITKDGKIIYYKPTIEEAEVGRLFICSLHTGIGKQILGEQCERATDALLKLGYVLFGGVRGLSVEYEPTQAQKDTLSEMGFDCIFDSTGTKYKF